MYASRDQNRISIDDLAHPIVACQFAQLVHAGKQRGFTDFSIDFSQVQSFFPNACVPLAGLISYYEKLESVDFGFENVKEALARACLVSPALAEDDLKTARNFPLNKVWRYQDIAGIDALVSGYRDAVARATVCGKGVIEGLEWSLNEVMDNVLQHSNADCGFVMGQVHANSKHIALCVFDYGQGILNSFKNTTYAPQTASDAITLALREGVTRNKKTNQGNGLWGLNNIVNANSGQLAITSGRGRYVAEKGEIRVFENQTFPSYEHATTTVDFQIDFDKPISVPLALGGHEPANFKVESLEDQAGNLFLKVADWPYGTGTRKSGFAIRNEVLNLLQSTSFKVIVDFSGVGVIASSFADEFLGMLISSMGIMGFMSRIQLRGMNETVQAIADRSIEQRMLQSGMDEGSLG